MWPFRRNRDEPSPDAAPSADASTASPLSGEADVARAERAPTGDWMTMPTVRTAIAPMPTTFRVQTLPEILTSHHDTRLSGSLGHAVSAEGPSGTIEGLTSAAGSNPTAPGRGNADRPLREPFHAPAATEEIAPLTVRRLATSGGAAPLATSGTASPTPVLPEPAVSRVLASPGPMPSPASLGSRPLPIARVVDAPAAASTAPMASVPSAPALSAEPTSSPLVGTDRVGGFEVDLEAMLAPESERPPLLSPPPDLAPPIQRRAQSDASSLPLRAPAAPSTPDLLPPIQRLATETPSAPTDAPRSTGGAASTAAAIPGGADPEHLTSNDAPTVGGSTQPLVSPSPTTPPSAADRTSPSVDLPLVAPAATAASPPSPDSPSMASPSPGSSPSVEPSPSTPSTPATSAVSAPVQRAAESGTDGTRMTSVQRAEDESGLAGLAPLLGGAALGASAGGPAAAGSDEGDSAGQTGEGMGLPLVSRSVDATVAGAAPDAPNAADPDDPSGGGDDEIAPTLGANDTGLGVAVQTLGESSSPAGPAPLDLPLAPPDPSGTLAPPAVAASIVDRPLLGSTDDGGSISSTAGASNAAAPQAAPSTAPLPPSATSGSGASSASSAAMRPLAAQRSLSSAPTSAPNPSSGASPSAAPGASPGALATVSRTAAPLSGGDGAATPSIPNPMTALAYAVPQAGPVHLQRQRDDNGDGGGGARPSEPRPLAVFRQTASAPAVPSSVFQDSSPLPLHSPALNVPSSTDLLVKAGLGERGSDGSFLRSTPPPGVESSFIVQRQQETPGHSASPAGINGGAPLLGVQRTVQVDAVQTSVAAPAGDGGAANLTDADVRKLYLKIRAELDADLRRQLEAKNRNGRYRP